jgi:transcriptional regulator with XRE-family HTH domain
MGKRSGDPRDADIARRVRALRLQRGLSQSALGSALGVTFQQVQKYESGTNRISAGRLYRIAQVLDAPIPFFYASDEERRGETEPRPREHDPEKACPGLDPGCAPVFGERSCSANARERDDDSKKSHFGPDVETDFLQNSGAMRLIRAYSRITDRHARQRLLRLTESLAAQ